jgi:hypothetical protein
VEPDDLGRGARRDGGEHLQRVDHPIGVLIGVGVLARVVGAASLIAIMLPALPAAAASTPPTAPGAANSIGIRLLDVPATEANDPRARLYVVDRVAPGAVINRRIEVTNTTTAVAHVALYAAAAAIIGTSFVGGPDRTANDLSTWSTVAPANPDIPAGGQLTATITIAIPTDAAPGEQYAVIWAEVRSASTGGAVVEVNRVGIRMYISVGPGAAPAANFTIDTLTAKRTHAGDPIVVAAVRNTGGRALDLSGTLQLSAGPGGLSAGPYPDNLGVTLAIADTESVTFTLNNAVPAGPWQAKITLHSGLLERTATATITFPTTGSAPPAAATSHTSRSPDIRIAELAIAILGIVLIIALLIRRRRPPPPAARRSPVQQPTHAHVIGPLADSTRSASRHPPHRL